MKIFRNLTFVALVALVVTLLSHIPITRAVAKDGDSHTLSLRVYFDKFGPPTVNFSNLNFGDQYTLGGAVARFETPNNRIGSIVIQFVVTAPQAAETMLYGVVKLPEGQISFTGLSPTQEPRLPGPITGGTGAFRNVRGEIDHKSLPGGVEELILTYNVD